MTPTLLETPPSRRPLPRRNGHPPPPPPPTGGGDGPDREPTPGRPGLSNAMLAVLFLIAAEVMFFIGLVSGFWVLRTAAAVWPPPLQPRLPLLLTGVNTLVLLASSLAMVVASRAYLRGDRPTALRWLGGAGGLGALFLLIQGYEWARLVHFGLTVSSGAYGAAFYTLIGAHAAHVLGALVWLVTIVGLAGRARRPLGPDAVRILAVYWHFVVGLWPVLYVSVYLL